MGFWFCHIQESFRYFYFLHKALICGHSTCMFTIFKASRTIVRNIILGTYKMKHWICVRLFARLTEIRKWTFHMLFAETISSIEKIQYLLINARRVVTIAPIYWTTETKSTTENKFSLQPTSTQIPHSAIDANRIYSAFPAPDMLVVYGELPREQPARFIIK